MTGRTLKKAQNVAAAAQADQYFTRPEIARFCLDKFEALLGEVAPKAWWVEPSAGDGSFLNILLERNRRVWAGDLHPQHDAVVANDYLAQPLVPRPGDLAHTVVVGNPPFGKRASLAVKFINRALRHGGMVGFIVPLQLRKWSAQKLVRKNARLVMDLDLPAEAFLFMGRPYTLRCCFQVWTTWPNSDLPGENLRLTHAPRTRHEDFQAWQYNCTEPAKKYFDYEWDFAVLRQGYGDYSVQYQPKDRDTMDRRKQWIFIKANTPQALRRLRGLDYVALSRKNTGTPGFGKADLVEAYIRAQDC